MNEVLRHYLLKKCMLPVVRVMVCHWGSTSWGDFHVGGHNLFIDVPCGEVTSCCLGKVLDARSI